MRIKVDNNLAIIANRAGKDINEMSRIMADALLNARLIENNDDYCGCSVHDCYGDKAVIMIIRGIIHKIGIKTIDDTIYDAFDACIIMGDGDCPECGGEMEMCECEGHEIPSGDRDTPPDYEIDCEKWCCKECGYYEWRDYTYDPIEED